MSRLLSRGPAMIVDLHTRIWDSSEELGPAVARQLRRRRTEPWHTQAGNADEHHDAMEPVGVAIVHGFESALLDAHIHPQTIAAHVERHPERLLGFAGIDPTQHRAVQRLEHAVDHLGLVGVTLSPAAAGFHPTDTRAMALFEACAHRRLPVLIEQHTLLARQTRLEFAQPLLLDEVARTFPDLRLLLGSCGEPFHDQALTLMGKHPTVFVDLAELALRPWPLYNVLARAHALGVLGQVLFGSGFPACTPERAIVALYSVNTLTHSTHLPPIPRELLRAIVEADSLTHLGLTPPNPTTLSTTLTPHTPTLSESLSEASGGPGHTPPEPSPSLTA